MRASEIDNYRQMTRVQVRRWLTASSVVATAFAAALLAIATNHFGSGFSSAVTHSISAAEVSVASQHD